jgi:hypothetical protein
VVAVDLVNTAIMHAIHRFILLKYYILLFGKSHGRRNNNHASYTHKIAAAADCWRSRTPFTADRTPSELYDYYGSIRNTRFLIDVLILQSMLYDSRGDEMIALEKLVEAIALAEPGGFIRPFLDAGPQIL